MNVLNVMGDLMMLNDVVSDNHQVDLNSKSIINLLTDNNYYLDKTIIIQKLDKEKLKGLEGSNLIVSIPSKILKNCLDYCSKQLGEDMEISDYILTIIMEYNQRYETQHLTTSSLVFNGRKPRKDVLKKLYGICSELKSYPMFPEFHLNEIKSGIVTSLENPDIRTLEKYLNCIKKFVEHKTNQNFGYNSRQDITGLHEIVLKALDENSG